MLQNPLNSRLSFPATDPPDPRRVSEAFQKGFLKGSLKGFRRVSEGFQKLTPSKTLLKPLADPFENPSATPSETPSETLLGSGGSVAGNESLDSKSPSLKPWIVLPNPGCGGPFELGEAF